MARKEQALAKTSSTALSPTQAKFQDVGRMLKGNLAQLEAALPSFLPPDRMVRVTLSSLRKTPQLLDCSRASLLGAIMQSAQLGLEIDNGLGHAYLVPYKGEAALLIGYKGLLDLVWRTGLIRGIYAREVYEKDEFSFRLGINEDLVHVPSMEADRGEIVAAYAVATLEFGRQFEVMTRAEIDAIMERAPGSRKADSPWRTHFHMMARKTAIRRLCKLLPMSVEKASRDLQKAIALEEAVEVSKAQPFDVSAGAFDPTAGLEEGDAVDALPPHDDPFDIDEADLGDAKAEPKE